MTIWILLDTFLYSFSKQIETAPLNDLQIPSLVRRQVELMSRDEQSVLVVSYAELKHCLEQAFDEVMQAATSAP